jgi:tRNA threonylcarbamoyladenosine biosynthesis protein TsaE
MGECIRSGACIVVMGRLGAGKTLFIRGACRGLGVDEDVLSPTFILFEEFAGRKKVAHVDLYRLEHERQVEELGVFDLLGSDTVLLAEWGDRSEVLMENADIVVVMDAGDEPDHRRITLSWSSRFDDAFVEVGSWSS